MNAPISVPPLIKAEIRAKSEGLPECMKDIKYGIRVWNGRSKKLMNIDIISIIKTTGINFIVRNPS